MDFRPAMDADARHECRRKRGGQSTDLDQGRDQVEAPAVFQSGVPGPHN